MNTKNSILLVMISILMFNCSGLKSYKADHFTFEKAFYQSWVTKTNEKGTDIVIELSNINKNVVFQSIAFRGFKIPVIQETNSDKTILKGVIITGESKLDLEHEITDEPDQLIYQYQNTTFVLPLESIERKDMIYY